MANVVHAPTPTLPRFAGEGDGGPHLRLPPPRSGGGWGGGIRRAFALLLALLLAAPALADDATLAAFAHERGLRDVPAFVETVNALRAQKRLPPRYLTKADAERRGWRPGDDLCRVARGGAIGGDRFGNYEHRLPEARGRAWREADLDFACGRRGAKRLLFSSDGLIYVTVDHYESFREVPR